MSIHYNYRGGGGNQSTSLPPADDDLESIKSDDLESIKSDDSVESPSVLLITTHGGYPSKKLKQFTSPTNIKKINAVTSGVCNYLDSANAGQIASNILTAINNGQITDMDYGSIVIQEILKFSDTEINDGARKAIQPSVDRLAYTRQTNRAYKITSVDRGESIVNKTYTVYPRERISSPSPFYDSITLLTERPYNDLIQEMMTRTSRDEEQEVTLLEILNYIGETRGINNLIIVDLTCSVTPHIDDRTNRSLNRHDSYKMGGYNRKTKRNKKKNYKKTKRSKKSKKKTKKNKKSKKKTK